MFLKIYLYFSLVCKALWNYCDNNYEKGDNQPLWFTEDQLKLLFSLFDESLCKNIFYLFIWKENSFCLIQDENNLESTDDEQMNEVNKQLWNDEYYPVASRLYQRLIEGNQHFQTIHQNNRS